MKRPASLSHEGHSKKPHMMFQVKLAPSKHDAMPTKILNKMVLNWVDKERNQLCKVLDSREWSTSSACSGTGMAEVATNEVFKLLQVVRSGGEGQEVRSVVNKYISTRDFNNNIVRTIAARC